MTRFALNALLKHSYFEDYQNERLRSKSNLKELITDNYLTIPTKTVVLNAS